MNQKIVEQYFTLNWSKETLDNFGFTRSCSQIGLLFNRSREKTHTQLSNPVEFFCGLLTLNYKTKERLVSPALCGLSKKARHVSNHLCVSKKRQSVNRIFNRPSVFLCLRGTDTMKCIHYWQKLVTTDKTSLHHLIVSICLVNNNGWLNRYIWEF